MNGPDHYKEAERLLDLTSTTPVVLARAQVHATLAVVAAVVDTGHNVHVETRVPWAEALS